MKIPNYFKLANVIRQTVVEDKVIEYLCSQNSSVLTETRIITQLKESEIEFSSLHNVF